MSVTVTATVHKSVTLRPTVKRRLLGSLKAYSELRAQVKVLEHAIEAQKAEIETIRAETGESAIELDGFKVTLVQPADRKKLEPKLLLAQGVSMRQIEDSYALTPVKSYVKISTPGEEEKDYGNR